MTFQIGNRVAHKTHKFPLPVDLPTKDSMILKMEPIQAIGIIVGIQFVNSFPGESFSIKYTIHWENWQELGCPPECDYTDTQDLELFPKPEFHETEISKLTKENEVLLKALQNLSDQFEFYLPKWGSNVEHNKAKNLLAELKTKKNTKESL